MKHLIFVAIVSLLFSLQGKSQGEKRMNFLGLNPSLTVEPYYDKGEYDLNIFPIVYQKALTRRMDLRVSSIVNYGVRKSTSTLSHLGGQIAFPFYIQGREHLMKPSGGFFAAPGMGFTRNRLEQHTNIGFWLEPGYNLNISEKWSISFGVQLGATHFDYDDGKKKWDNHFGIKIFFGRWFLLPSGNQ